MTADSIFGDAAARKLEAAYLTPDVVEQRRATLRALALRPGERVLDVGSGPGLLAAEMAQVVGLAGHVIGIDVSDAMLALGQRRCANISGTGRLSFLKADAWTQDLRRLGRDGRYFFSLNRYLFHATKG